MRQEGEPSVDQILRSIKKVLAREPRLRPPAEDSAAPGPEDEPGDNPVESGIENMLESGGGIGAPEAPFAPPELIEPAYEEEAEELRGLSEKEAMPELEPEPEPWSDEAAGSSDAPEVPGLGRRAGAG